MARIVWLLGWLILLAMPSHAYVPNKLTIGFAPWDNPVEIGRVASDVTRLLAGELKMSVEPRVASDYAGVVEAMKNGQVDVAFFPPAAYVLAEQQAWARVILKSLFKGGPAYYAAIITRQDSGIRKLGDLKGKTFAFVDPTSTSGNIYPRVMLLNAGIKPERDMRILYAGGHDAVVLAVLNKRVAAGACYSNDPAGKESAWTQPGLVPNAGDRKKISIISLSKPIPADTIAVRAQLDTRIVEKIREFFLRLSATPQGRKKIREVYHVDGFLRADPSDYEPVREAFEKVGFEFKK